MICVQLVLTLFYFNSIKVQLELDLSHRNMFTAKVFQFHKGTIRTVICRRLFYHFYLFQFHKGTIRTR